MPAQWLSNDRLQQHDQNSPRMRQFSPRLGLPRGGRWHIVCRSLCTSPASPPPLLLLSPACVQHMQGVTDETDSALGPVRGTLDCARLPSSPGLPTAVLDALACLRGSVVPAGLRSGGAECPGNVRSL